MFFKVIHQIARSHGKKNRQFLPKLSVSGLQFEFTDGFEMMHKASRSIEEVPYCFSMSSIKFQDCMGKKINDLIPILSKITRPVAAIKSLRFALFVFFCLFLAATKQLYKWYFPSVCPSVCLSVCPSVRHTFLTMFPSSYHHEIFRSYYQ